MCLTTAALLMFLELLPPEIVSRGEDVILVRAQDGLVTWTKNGTLWCSDKGYDGLERP